MEEQMKELVGQMTSVNAGRADYYRRLASYFFKELTEEQIKVLAAQDFTGFDAGDELLAEGYSDMKAYLRRLNSGTRQQLAADYAHTFLTAGNYETFAATPFESVFTSPSGLMMQEARDEVYKMYCSEHLQPEAKLQVPEDHVSFEFEFIAALLDRTNEAMKAGNWARALELAGKVSQFHTEHQLNWIDDLCDAVMDVAETRFYRGVSKVTRAYNHMDTEVIKDELEVLQEIAQAEGVAAGCAGAEGVTAGCAGCTACA